MALELYKALIMAGVDPNYPPADHHPPADKAFAEYQKRGGTQYNNADSFVADLVREVTMMEVDDE
jgi:hypothetical protein